MAGWANRDHFVRMKCPQPPQAGHRAADGLWPHDECEPPRMIGHHMLTGLDLGVAGAMQECPRPNPQKTLRVGPRCREEK